MAARIARCFLCHTEARLGTLRRVGSLWACADEDRCDERARNNRLERERKGAANEQ